MAALYYLHRHRIQELRQAYLPVQKDLLNLEEQIELLRAVIADSFAAGLDYPDAPRSLAQYRFDLGSALYEHYMHTNGVSNLVEAETQLRLALTGLPPHTLSIGNSILGSVLRERAYDIRSNSLVEEALSFHRRLLDAILDLSDFERVRYHRELGFTLRVHYVVNANKDDYLVESMNHLKTAQVLFANMGVVDHACAAALIQALVILYHTQANKAHLHEAALAAARALMECGSDHRDFFRIVWSVSTVHQLLAWSHDDMVPLLGTLDILRVALSNAPAGWVPLIAVEVANALTLCFVKQASEECLSEAIMLTTSLVEGLDPGASQWHRMQGSLADLWWYRFKITGAAEDIENAVHAAESALERSNSGTLIHFRTLGHLSLCRADQYRAFADMSHLNQCIDLLEKVVELAPLQSNSRTVAQHNLLDSLRMRAEATGSLLDLDRAVRLAPELNTVQSFNHPNAPRMMQEVGSVFLLRFEITSQLEDLERATEYAHAAVQMCANRSSQDFEYHNVLDAYSKILRVRYEVMHETEGMAKALAQQKLLVDIVPISHADRTAVLCGLAQTLISTNLGQADIKEALDHLLEALRNKCCPASRRLKDVADVLMYQAKHSPVVNHENALELSNIYSICISLLPQVASFGLDPRTQLAVIARSGQLTTQGASHAVDMSQHNFALEMLEAGRSIFWTQRLHLKTSFADLPPSIGDRLRKITSALAQPMPDFGGGGSAKDRELGRRRQLGDEFTAVLSEAREIPGFEDLLQNASFIKLARAAREHPIVVLVAGERKGHGIIILDNAHTIAVSLDTAPEAVLKDISHRIETHSRDVRSRGVRKVPVVEVCPTDVYREIWTMIMLPIIGALGWPKAQGRDRRRLTLCPTGVFMQLPLHAAGIHTGENQVCCSDYFVSSYTPSIGALLHAQQTVRPVRRVDANTLIVAVENPFEGAPLSLTSKEARTVRSYVSPSAEVIEVSKSEDLCEHIRSASIMHMACHGTQNLSNPLQSGFFLEDELLPVSKLMQLELPQAFLAVLSACETAKGDATQPDQAIHLAATMLFAGFKSVVATMWFMRDLEGPDVAESIYSALFKEDDDSEFLNPDDVPYALDDAVQNLRKTGLDPSFWATYVHIGI